MKIKTVEKERKKEKIKTREINMKRMEKERTSLPN